MSLRLIGLNLLRDPWIPVRRRSGVQDVIRPAQLTGGLDDDPVSALDWPRADFRIACLEFLVGLLATACPPLEQDDWLERWDAPPMPEVLDAAFAPIAHAFFLDGNGPRFLQDHEDLVSGTEPIERLLIESPGDSTVRKNTDLLVRRDRFAWLGRPAAAMALHTFQSWAPAGGAGNRTGLRGGGPLVTLVAPREPCSLWHLVWANVPSGGMAPAPQDLPRVFPWLAPTLTSEGPHMVTPDGNAHPLQCWWGMPRRIRLDFTDADPERACDLTGIPDQAGVTGWRQRPRGANYAAWGKVHPLTPHYTARPGTEWLPLHPRRGGIGYRHWLGLVTTSSDGRRIPAAIVSDWHDGFYRARAVGEAPRLLAAGYDVDNMKARGFVESEMPLPGSADAATRVALDALAAALVQSAEQVAGLLRSTVRHALFSAGATVKLDAELLSALRERLWEQTEPAFFRALFALAGGGDPAVQRSDWHQLLRSTALTLFHEAAPILPELSVATSAIRIATARRRLGLALAGYGKEGGELFATLSLPPPVSKAKRKGKAA